MCPQTFEEHSTRLDWDNHYTYNITESVHIFDLIFLLHIISVLRHRMSYSHYQLGGHTITGYMNCPRGHETLDIKKKEKMRERERERERERDIQDQFRGIK